jgi:hypothetical protein
VDTFTDFRQRKDIVLEVEQIRGLLIWWPRIVDSELTNCLQFSAVWGTACLFVMDASLKWPLTFACSQG